MRTDQKVANIMNETMSAKLTIDPNRVNLISFLDIMKNYDMFHKVSINDEKNDWIILSERIKNDFFTKIGIYYKLKTDHWYLTENNTCAIENFINAMLNNGYKLPFLLHPIDLEHILNTKFNLETLLYFLKKIDSKFYNDILRVGYDNYNIIRTKIMSDTNNNTKNNNLIQSWNILGKNIFEIYGIKKFEEYLSDVNHVSSLKSFHL